jgi:bifunctional DNA-binding transcriptional regulator/antitoxin component of YhaV-PrlF toxin-antitoxin module
MGFVTDVKVSANGRMVLPQAVPQAIGMTGETRLVLAVEGDKVRLSPIPRTVSHVQEIYRNHVVQDATSDDFLTERRKDGVTR